MEVTLGHGDSETALVDGVGGLLVKKKKRKKIPAPTAQYLCATNGLSHSSRSDSVTCVRNRQLWERKNGSGSHSVQFWVGRERA